MSEFDIEAIEFEPTLNTAEDWRNAVLDQALTSYPEILSSNDVVLGALRALRNRIRELEADNAELIKIASVDAMTQLLNRRSGREIAQNTIELNKDKRFGVFYADINGLKILNDKAGHHVGDQLIINVAMALLGSVRGDNDHDLEHKKAGFYVLDNGQERLQDILYRGGSGSDEFVVVAEVEDDVPEERVVELRDTVDQQAKSYIESLLAKLPHEKAKELESELHGIDHYISIGYHDIEGSNLDEAINLAEQGMYDDKRQQREASVARRFNLGPPTGVQERRSD